MRQPVDEIISACSELLDAGRRSAQSDLNGDLLKVRQSGDNLRIICDGMVELARTGSPGRLKSRFIMPRRMMKSPPVERTKRDRSLSLKERCQSRVAVTTTGT
ncbi:MAG: hypothetical protein IPL01_21665 [Acidobacteria bacterium]|nr:hypothetical protein [Acidobacteriota bacterium]